jgi:hypothetical protein
MEVPALRSLPVRLPDPVNPVHALAQVEAMLPELSPDKQRALALVDLGASPRADAAGELGVPEAELSRMLAAGRKALRRTQQQLPSGGWCERAERLFSDHLDGALAPAGQARLDAHLGTCERCATHERKLVQAHDRLVEGYLAAHAPARPRAVEAPPAELRLAEPSEPDAPAARLGGGVALRASLALAILLVIAAVVLAAIGILHVP